MRNEYTDEADEYGKANTQSYGVKKSVFIRVIRVLTPYIHAAS
jgi:hypothetical protein